VGVYSGIVTAQHGFGPDFAWSGGKDGTRTRAQEQETISVPEEVTKRLAEVLRPITREPQIVETFNKLGIDALGTTPEEAFATIRKDIPIYSQIVDIAGVRLK
jgi:hypothetical protein